jgi:hypothetical protein
MATSILSLQSYFTAENLAACELSALDGVLVDQHGGISRAEFLRYFERVSREAALFFTSENA